MAGDDTASKRQPAFWEGWFGIPVRRDISELSKALQSVGKNIDSICIDQSRILKKLDQSKKVSTDHRHTNNGNEIGLEKLNTRTATMNGVLNGIVKEVKAFGRSLQMMRDKIDVVEQETASLALHATTQGVSVTSPTDENSAALMETPCWYQRREGA
ncbi:hypothetical protein LTR86_003926 [Recurvomyces mirabilis]|nr:hypothetical protein LTR86_003926 [Recurvomyces mirabilis]